MPIPTLRNIYSIYTRPLTRLLYIFNVHSSLPSISFVLYSNHTLLISVYFFLFFFLKILSSLQLQTIPIYTFYLYFPRSTHFLFIPLTTFLYFSYYYNHSLFRIPIKAYSVKYTDFSIPVLYIPYKFPSFLPR